MNDDEMLATMRSSLTGIAESLTHVHLEQPVSTRSTPGPATIGFAGASLAGVGTAGLALSLGLALAAGGSSGRPRCPRLPPAHGRCTSTSTPGRSTPCRAVWSTSTSASCRDPALLRKTLADAGIPAIVTFGEICTGPNGAGTDNLHEVIGKTAADGEARLTLNPAGIPHGSELSIGIVPASKRGVLGLNAGLLPGTTDGAQLTCGRPGTSPAGQGTTGPVSPAGSGTVKAGVGS